MTPDFISAIQAEERVLAARLDAVRATMKTYGITPSELKNPVLLAAVTGAKPQRAFASGLPPQRTPTARAKDRYTTYGQIVVDAAVEAARTSNRLPLKTRELAEMVQAQGIEIRGNDPVNALGALLARCTALQSLGKRGWTLANQFDLTGSNENGAAEAAPEAEGAPTPSIEKPTEGDPLFA